MHTSKKLEEGSYSHIAAEMHAIVTKCYRLLRLPCIIQCWMTDPSTVLTRASPRDNIKLIRDAHYPYLHTVNPNLGYVEQPPLKCYTGVGYLSKLWLS